MATTLTMPALSRTMEDATLVTWLVSAGDHVRVGDVIADIETDKASMEIEADAAGIIGELLVAEGTEGVLVGAPIAQLLEADAASEKSGTVERVDETPDAARLLITPVARRMALDHGLDPNALAGSGPHGRIVKADVARKIAGSASPSKDGLRLSSGTAPNAPGISQTTAEVTALYAGRPFDEVPVDGAYQRLAAHLADTQRTIPHLHLGRDVQVDALLSFRKDLNKAWQAKGIRASLTSCVVKAAGLALRDVPSCNAAWAGDRILAFKTADIVVASGNPSSFSPIRDADTKSLEEISAEMIALSNGAKEEHLSPRAQGAGALSVSNLGKFGVEFVHGIVAPPQGAALSLGAARKTPVVGEMGEIRAASVMALMLSVDNRLIDAQAGAALLSSIADYIEAPARLLL